MRFVLFMLFSLSLHALSVEEAIARFIHHNPSLHIAQWETQKSRADLITAQEHPNPTLQAGYEFIDVQHHWSDQARGSNAQLTMVFAHPFELGGKRARRVDVANAAIGYTDLLYAQKIQASLIDLLQAYYALAKDHTNLDNAIANNDAFETLLAIAKAKLTKGFLSENEYQRLLLQQIEYTKEVENQRLLLMRDRRALAILLALPPEEVDVQNPHSAHTTFATLETLLHTAEQRSDTRAAHQNLTLANAQYALEKANATPNLTLSAEYASFGPYYEPLMGMFASIPIPLYDRNEGDIEKARLHALQAHDIYTQTLSLAQADILQNYTAWQSAQKLYALSYTGFDNARILNERQQRIFALKGISILELLDTQRNYREFQKNLAQAQMDSQLAEALLRLSIGELGP